ncbi:pyridoxamine 5'-phosphate oxidase, partial [Paragonimus westermani]
RSGVPSVRYVLLKELDEHGFYFFTNYESRKAGELEDNPNASLLFYWEPLQRQVRVEGTVTQLSPGRSEIYFASRPKCSQLAATISPQSRVIPSRQHSISSFRILVTSCHSYDFRGGYVLCPHTVEFWQGQTNRLHDRIRFRRANTDDTTPVDPECTHIGDDGWVYERLAP